MCSFFVVIGQMSRVLQCFLELLVVKLEALDLLSEFIFDLPLVDCSTEQLQLRTLAVQCCLKVLNFLCFLDFPSNQVGELHLL